MECSRVASLLSRYIDGDLTAESRRMVDEHLSGCERCSADLNEILGAVRTLSSLERMAAPQGFLGRVHERLEQPSRTRRFLRSLFSPLYIKLPLEAVGLGIAALLIVFVHHETASFKETAPIPALSQVPASIPSPSDKVAAVRSDESAPALDRLKNSNGGVEVAAPPATEIPSAPLPMGGASAAKDETPPAPQSMRKMKTAAGGQPESSLEGSTAAQERYILSPGPVINPPAPAVKSIQLALSILPPAKPQETARESSSTATAPPTDGSATPLRSAEDRVDAERAKGGNLRQQPAQTSLAPRGSMKPLPRPSAAPPAPSVDREPMAGDPGEALTRIGRCAASMGGAVLETVYLRGTRTPQSVTVEVPTSSYIKFVEGLQRIGPLRKPYPESPPPDALPSLRIRITLLTSN